MRVQNHIFSIWKNTCKAFGYEEYEGPVFEQLELYTQKSGEEIVEQLYCFKDKGGRDLALRPELTPSLARMVNLKAPELKFPLRWFAVPRLYRYERAQKGRLREFYQLNMDIIGCTSLTAEADLISAVIEMLCAFGLNDKDFAVGLSSRRLIREFLAAQIPEDKIGQVYRVLDKRGKITEDLFNKMLTDLSISQGAIESINSFLNATTLSELKQMQCGGLLDDAVTELEELFNTLERVGYTGYLQLDLSIIRGLDYYTGVVFEVFDRNKSLRAIAGGGRYDNLLANLGGKQLSGVGFGIGDVVLYELLKEKGLLPEKIYGPDYFIVTFGDVDADLLSFARALRGRGKKVLYPLESVKVKKQMSQAVESGADKVIFFGSDKAPAGHFEVKNLETREQAIVAFDDL
ncbi:MAG: histidine--tRNA ligase [Fibrobacteria bacterium]|nr:histidine--tRNA ligase [Fibrobacteria bacterium]